MEHERNALGRNKRIEHDEQRRTHRIRQRPFMQWIACRRGRLGAMRREILLAARLARSQHIKTHARDHRSEPRAGIFYAAGSERLSRSHDSCTASFASAADPSIR